MKAVLFLALCALFGSAIPVETRRSAALKHPSLVQADAEYVRYHHQSKLRYDHSGKLKEVSAMAAEPGATTDDGKLKQLVAISARTGKQRITKLPGGPYDVDKLMQGFSNKQEIYEQVLASAKQHLPRPCSCTGADCPGKVPFFITYGPPASGKGYVIGKIEQQFYGKSGCLAEAQVDEMVALVPQKRDAPNPKVAQDMYWIFRDIGEKVCDDVISFGESQKVPIVFEMTQPDAWTVSHVSSSQFKTNYMSFLIMPLVTPAKVFERSYARREKAGRLPDVNVIKSAFEVSTSKFLEFALKLDKAVVYNNDNTEPAAMVTIEGGIFTITDEVKDRCVSKSAGPLTTWTGTGAKPDYLVQADTTISALGPIASKFFCELCCKGTAAQQTACGC